MQVDGDLVAPNQVWKASMDGDWITFHQINGLIIDGKGQLNGNGPVWWKCREDHVMIHFRLIGVSSYYDLSYYFDFTSLTSFFPFLYCNTAEVFECS